MFNATKEKIASCHNEVPQNYAKMDCLTSFLQITADDA